MKLIFQITIGVFIGTLVSQFTFDSWQTHQEAIAKEATEKLQAEQDKFRAEQGERIRALLMQKRNGDTPPAGFVPDDAQAEIPKKSN
jgi:hypothetical protein